MANPHQRPSEHGVDGTAVALVEGKGFDLTADAGKAGVVKEAVEAPEGAEGGVDEGFYLVLPRHIAGQEVEGRPEGFSQGLPLSLLKIAAYDPGPLVDKLPDRCFADPAGGAGDDGDLAF